MPKKTPDAFKAFLLALAMGVAGAVFLMVVIRPFGPVMITDSAFYAQAARSFAMGDGFVNYERDGLAHPMTHYPP